MQNKSYAISAVERAKRLAQLVTFFVESDRFLDGQLFNCSDDIVHLAELVLARERVYQNAGGKFCAFAVLDCDLIMSYAFKAQNHGESDFIIDDFVMCVNCQNGAFVFNA